MQRDGQGEAGWAGAGDSATSAQPGHSGLEAISPAALVREKSLGFQVKCKAFGKGSCQEHCRGCLSKQSERRSHGPGPAVRPSSCCLSLVLLSVPRPPAEAPLAPPTEGLKGAEVGMAAAL